MLFLGQTGLDKRAVDNALRDEIAVSLGGTPASSRWEAFHFESFLSGSCQSFVRLDSQARQASWTAAMARLGAAITASTATHVGIFIHGNYWHNGELFNHILLGPLAQIPVTCVVTLVDDIYDIHSRILHREEEGEISGVELTLPQVVTWRGAEIGLGDLLARNLLPNRRLPHFVFAVKHPPQVLRQLLLERERLPVYASFPISKVRRPGRLTEDRQLILRGEIDAVRERLRQERYTLLDPLTIDEYRMHEGRLLPPWQDNSGGHLVLPESAYHSETLAAIEREKVWLSQERDIEAQLESRDVRLVDVAQAVSCYRPMAYDGSHSGGTLEELRYGQYHGKDTFVVHFANTDGGPYRVPGAWRSMVSPRVCTSQEQLLQQLQTLQERRSQSFRSGVEPQEWTLAAGSHFGIPGA